MKGKLILLLILTYTAISRFFLIDKIPPILDSTVLNGRFFSGTASIGSIFLIFLLIRNFFKNSKIALLSSLVFSILPWTIEQGRIVSQPNFALFLVLFFLLVTKYFSNSSTSGESIRPPPRCLDDFVHSRGGFKAYLLYLIIIPLIFIFFYPQFWIFRVHEFKFNFHSLVYNLFTLLSFDFLFFKNISFWWGGVKEFGIMYLSFLPFFAVGIYKIIELRQIKLILLFLLVATVSAASQFFPETREFYFSTPILSLVVALGIYYCFLQTKFAIRILFAGLFFLMIYEFSQFYHFYFIHYPQEVISNFSQIHESF